MFSSRARAVPLFLFSTALCVMAAAQPRLAKADTVPDYFLKSWTVDRDCTEAHAGANSGHTTPGQKFQVVSDADGTYSLKPISNGVGRWSRGWQDVKLEYRAGSPMSAIPADMECVPGQEESSSFLAQSGFASSAEPYYGFEHWYGQVTIHGEKHHLLIFPRNAQGPASAAVVLIDVDASGNLQLDHNGTIIIE
ncbi:MAG: hypothetical protein WDO56_23060 [Gammaproteobacteria bacterium]